MDDPIPQPTRGPRITSAAQAVIAALVQREYDLSPEDVPDEAYRMARAAAAAISAAVEYVDWSPYLVEDMTLVEDLLGIAAELEGRADG